MKTKMRGLAIAVAVLGFTMSAAQAGLIIVPKAGVVDTAQFEPVLNGGTGFPLGVFGYQHDAELRVNAPGTYRFTFVGAGDAAQTNTFTVAGGGSFTAVGPGGTGLGSTPVNSFFDVFFNAAGIIPFTYSTSGGCSISNGSNSTSGAESCHYLTALANSPGPLPALGPQNVAYIGFSDSPETDFDFQDLSVRVEALVPAPASLALLGAALAGLGIARRRKA